MPTRAEICQRCDDYLAAVSAHDPDAIVALFAADAEQVDPVGTPPNVGHEQIRDFFTRTTAVGFTLTRTGPITVVGHHAAFQFRADFDDPGLAAITSTDVLTFDDQGRITSLVAYPDGEADPDAPVTATR